MLHVMGGGEAPVAIANEDRCVTRKGVQRQASVWCEDVVFYSNGEDIALLIYLCDAYDCVIIA